MGLAGEIIQVKTGLESSGVGELRPQILKSATFSCTELGVPDILPYWFARNVDQARKVEHCSALGGLKAVVPNSCELNLEKTSRLLLLLAPGLQKARE
jgi:hypothetical protein